MVRWKSNGSPNWLARLVIDRCANRGLPTLTLYARVGKGDVALGRWPTTIGGWKTIEKSDGSMALKHKGPRKLVDW